MGKLFLIAFRNVLQQRRRSLILGSAIAFVSMLMVVEAGFANGIQSSIFRSATVLLTGHVNVSGYYKFSATSVAPLISNYKELEDWVKKEVPEAEYVATRARGFGRIISDNKNQFALLGGVDVENEKGFAEVLEIEEGSLDALKEPNTILIFNKHKENLDVELGDELLISTPTLRGVQNTISVRIAAVASDIGFLSTFTMYVPTKTIRDLYQLSDTTTGVMMIYLKDRNKSEEVVQRLRNRLEGKGYELMPKEAIPLGQKLDNARREGWTGQRMDVTSWQDEISFLSRAVNGIDMFARFILMFLLLIVVVGVMNVMWMAIRERTSEIGTLRAIGMPRWQVLVMFLMEAATLSTIATTVGGLLGYAIAAGANAAEIEVASTAAQLFLMRDTIFVDVDVNTVVTALVTVVLFTTAGAFFPARRAAKMPPVSAINRLA